MAISRAARPEVIVAGNVERIRDLKRKADNEIYGYEVVMRQDSGAGVGVTIYQATAAKMGNFPSVGEHFAAVATVEESRDFGATLIYEREPWGDLDSIQSAAAASVAA